MRGIVTGLLMVSAMLMSGAVRAEVQQVTIARQFGLPYLPMVLMQQHELIEKHAAERGVNLRPEWVVISAASSNESLIAGAIDINATGTGPLILVWDRTRTNLGVRAIAAVSEMPMRLNSRNPNFTSIAEFNPQADRIAMPAIGLGSMQGLTLRRAATDMFGFERNNHFDVGSVSMTHPDATAALLSGRHEVNAHFTTPPYSYLQLETDGVHTVMSSFDVWGPSTLITLNTTARFADANPVAMDIIVAALREAQEMAKTDRAAALADYIAVTGEQLSDATTAAFLDDEEVDFNVGPRGMLAVARFMHEMGGISAAPDDWRELFHTVVHEFDGS